MTNTPVMPTPRSTPLSLPAQAGWTEAFHVFVVWAFVIGQPVLDRWQSNSVFLGMERPSLAAMLGVITLIFVPVPLLLSLVLLAIRAGNVRYGAMAQRIVLAGLFGLGGLLLGRWLMHGFTGSELGWEEIAQTAIALLAMCGLSLSYGRSLLVRQMVTWGGLGLVVFPASFLLSRPIQSVLSESQDPPPDHQAAHPVPLVIVVFDGLSAPSLLNQKGEIDAGRFPNFARLAGLSTWYRNATTVHPRTDHALPALLTGRLPVDGTPPTVQSYPDNLLARLQATGQYQLTIFEPFTMLGPESLKHQLPPRTTAEVIEQTTSALSQVYFKLVLPPSLSSLTPNLPRRWFGLPENPADLGRERTGLIRYGWESQRHVQVDHFVNTLQPQKEPHLWFLHVALPHPPFRYFPSGRPYVQEQSFTKAMLGAYGPNLEDWESDEFAVDQAWRRYLLQLGYADRCLGQILDRLHDTSLMDEAILVVAADHGYSFRPGMSSRVATPENLGELMSVPLFIKRPHQSQGAVSDRNVETIDVWPTLAEQIGLPLDTPVDGESLDASDRGRGHKTLVTPRETLILPATSTLAETARRRQLARFGEGSWETVTTVGLREDLLGQSIREWPVRDQDPLEIVLTNPVNVVRPGNDPFEVPSLLLEGAVLEADHQHPVVLAISIRDRIVAVTRTLNTSRDPGRWEALLPESTEWHSQKELSLWQVIGEGTSTSLRPCDVYFADAYFGEGGS